MEVHMDGYPVTVQIDYSDQSDRLTVLFRIFMVIPIFIILALLIGGGDSDPDAAERVYYVGTGGIVVIPTILMILFRRKYPRWWFDWNLELTRFATRVFSYLLLLRDEYPSTDEEQAVHIDILYPDAEKDLNRWLPLIKWFLAIPHIVILALLGVAVIFNTIITWFIILITGSYPRGLFDFTVGVIRWSIRVEAYAFLLTTDQYPPFTLSD